MHAATAPTTQSLSDVARGVTQQIVLWGQDVPHEEANLLLKFGLERNPSLGLTGTSCYSMPWQGGRIELHRAVASWTPPPTRTGLIFCRDRGNIALWHNPHAPIPGRERGITGTIEERWLAFQPLLLWMITYEEWIDQTYGNSWLQRCWRNLKRPKDLLTH